MIARLGLLLVAAALGAPAPWTTMTLGGRSVLTYPGFPGPDGTEAFYYVVPVSSTLAIEVYGRRRYFETPRAPTGYDRVIEQILGTLRLFPAAP